MIKTNQIQSISGKTFNVEELSILGGSNYDWYGMGNLRNKNVWYGNASSADNPMYVIVQLRKIISSSGIWLRVSRDNGSTYLNVAAFVGGTDEYFTASCIVPPGYVYQISDVANQLDNANLNISELR